MPPAPAWPGLDLVDSVVAPGVVVEAGLPVAPKGQRSRLQSLGGLKQPADVTPADFSDQRCSMTVVARPVICGGSNHSTLQSVTSRNPGSQLVAAVPRAMGHRVLDVAVERNFALEHFADVELAEFRAACSVVEKGAIGQMSLDVAAHCLSLQNWKRAKALATEVTVAEQQALVPPFVACIEGSAKTVENSAHHSDLLRPEQGHGQNLVAGNHSEAPVEPCLGEQLLAFSNRLPEQVERSQTGRRDDSLASDPHRRLTRLQPTTECSPEHPCPRRHPNKEQKQKKANCWLGNKNANLKKSNHPSSHHRQLPNVAMVQNHIDVNVAKNTWRPLNISPDNVS
jgi:hypothetical protein